MKAFEGRERGLRDKSEALRVFHGPGEGFGRMRDISVDRFGSHYWITHWQLHVDEKSFVDAPFWPEYFKKVGATSAVFNFRPLKGTPSAPVFLLGESSQIKFSVQEGRRKYLIDPGNTLHPGLFLDHAPLRDWLEANSGGLTVLNTFAYTGSLSVACGIGGAAHVTTLDLSKVTTEWARENWRHNNLPDEKGDFVYGDVFEWLPKWRRKDRKFDCVILDPPSFSRGKSGSFSTAKDLVKLHQMALALLNPDGILITSINSANISRSKFEADVFFAVDSAKRKCKILKTIELPPTFPVLMESEEDHYLKGLILKVPGS